LFDISLFKIQNLKQVGGEGGCGDWGTGKVGVGKGRRVKMGKDNNNNNNVYFSSKKIDSLGEHNEITNM
jgi:hypothetical protein